MTNIKHKIKGKLDEAKGEVEQHKGGMSQKIKGTYDKAKGKLEENLPDRDTDNNDVSPTDDDSDY